VKQNVKKALTLAGAMALGALAEEAALVFIEHQRLIRRTEPAPEPSWTPDPMPYLMDPVQDYLSQAENLVAGMFAIEESPFIRHTYGEHQLLSQKIRAQEMYQVREFYRDPAAGTVYFYAVWDDGYREFRRMHPDTPMIVRELEYRPDDYPWLDTDADAEEVAGLRH
jgi:hypothetical protein